MHALSEHRGFDSNDVLHPSVPVVMPVGLARPGCLLALVMVAGATQAAQVVINGPAGSGEFGRMVTILPNGNIVVADPDFDAPGPIMNVGAVHLYRPDGSLVSTVRGSRAFDLVGSGGVVVLANGNFVVISPVWDDGANSDAGAVTFVPGRSGISGVVSAANSLVGGQAGDQVGSDGVTALVNGNYVVISSYWGNGATFGVGAVTHGSGTSGVSGVVSSANSLVGSSVIDRVGSSGVIALPNGNYVVRSPNWRNGDAPNAGAVTLGSGTTGITGVVSAGNSLVGSALNDRVGNFSVTVLTNGNYVVSSPNWRNGAALSAGAVTFGSGASGITGVVSLSNSLVGSASGDQVGNDGVTVLASGNYVVRSPNWNGGAVARVGAVTFGSGTGGVAGVVSSANSLVGGTANDAVGGLGVIPLSNGNYVVVSPYWDNGGATNAGAVTFGSGTSGIKGVVSTANSLVGGSAGDGVGEALGVPGVTALTNGNYVVSSPYWDNGAIANVGAVTFASGTSGITGPVSPANSLVGSAASDLVGFQGVTALTNGNFVVQSSDWSNGAIADVGAVTFGSGTSGITGVVSPANSLVGGTAGDVVGGLSVTPLTNGNYVVRSPGWDNGAIVDAGAVTFGSGTTGTTGVISPANSLIGSTSGDAVGLQGVTALSNGNFVVQTARWDNGAVVDAGAVTFGLGTSTITGVISPANSLVGSTASDFVGISGVIALPNGNYVVSSLGWDNGSIVDAGAVTLGLSSGGVVGAVTSTHSVLGVAQFSGSSTSFSYDRVRNQLSVGQPRSNRVVLHRTGIATDISIVGNTPDPSNGGEPVTFTATTTATPNAPTNGQVTFTANTGETCVDTTPTSTSATTADWSCSITFTANGVSSVVAEYTGSIIHAYSGSAPELHTTIVEPPLFADGFEGP
jgi:hypothetical protein